MPNSEADLLNIEDVKFSWSKTKTIQRLTAKWLWTIEIVTVSLARFSLLRVIYLMKAKSGTLRAVHWPAVLCLATLD